ncbi:MAG: PQQ-dependent sugar dehydrogenase, partial [Cyclobacteriaceae bacterium]|nr:PQQ-dependent sugar dehydrogenase [Cyclobacteriaceae bacterium]
MKISTLLLATIIFWGCQSNQEQQDQEEITLTVPVFADDGGLELPENFISTVVIDSTHRNARHLAVNENGDIYLKMRSETIPGVLALRDTDGDAKADESVAFGNFKGTGIGIHNGYLYASSHEEVFRYKLMENSLLPDTTAELVVTGFPEQNEHADKSITFDNSGHIYVNVGAPSNACMENHRTAGSAGMDPCPQRERQASIWRFDANTLGQTQEQDGHQYCKGVRNCVAITWNSATNSLYAAQHGRDQLSMFWPEMFDDKQNAELPAEEFIQISDGDDFGWPFCYYDQLQNVKILAPEYGGDGKQVGRCAEKKDPIMAFPGHMAPNDLLFYQGSLFPEKYRNGAFIAFHGSWNRAPEPQ